MMYPIHGMITVSKEDYLKAILEAEAEGVRVISATLAHWLKVSPPAVTMALRRLKRDGMVRVAADGHVQLTAEGRKIARSTVNRHHLIERMLHEIFGFPWYKVHDEAERLEHSISADFEAILAKRLGREGLCPHGNHALPENPAARRRRGLRLLHEAEVGGWYKVASVYERDRDLLEFLEARGLRPGARVRVLVRNYDETLGVETEDKRSSIGRPAAERVWIAQARK